MVGLVTGRSTLLAVLVGWRLPIRTCSLRRIRRRSLLLLLGLLLIAALLLAIAGLLRLVPWLLLPVCCWLGVAVLVVTCWLAISIVAEKRQVRTCLEKVGSWGKQVFYFGQKHKPLWRSGSRLLTITRVGRLGSISWLRAIRLRGSWSSSSRRSIVIGPWSITLGWLAVAMIGGLGGRIASYKNKQAVIYNHCGCIYYVWNCRKIRWSLPILIKIVHSLTCFYFCLDLCYIWTNTLQSPTVKDQCLHY